MTNLVQLRPKPDNLEQIHILISERILALYLHYKESFLYTALDINNDKFDVICRRHLLNLIATYGHGDVSSLILVMFQSKLEYIYKHNKVVS